MSFKVGLQHMGLRVKEHAPAICFGIGIASMFGAVVTAVMAGRKHDAVIQDHLDRLDVAKAEVVYPENYEPEVTDPSEIQPIVRTEKEIKKAVTHEYFVTAGKLCVLYAPTTALTAISAIFLTKSYNIQATRFAGLSAAYTGLQSYIRQYEENNIKLNGEESHRMCKYGFKEVEETVVDPETGETKVIKKNVVNETPDDVKRSKTVFHDQFLTYNSQTSDLYTGIAQHDINDLRNAQDWLRRTYWSRGWVTVNDLQSTLLMELTKEGMVEGWVVGCGEEPDIGLDDPINNRTLAFYNGEDILLNLNIHGNVYALLSEKERKSTEALAQNIGKSVEETKQIMEENYVKA